METDSHLFDTCRSWAHEVATVGVVHQSDVVLLRTLRLSTMSLSTRLSTPTRRESTNGLFSTIGIAPHDPAWSGEPRGCSSPVKATSKSSERARGSRYLMTQDVVVAGLLGKTRRMLDAFFEQLAFLGVAFGFDRHYAWEGDVSITARGTGMPCTLCKLCTRPLLFCRRWQNIDH